MITLKTAVQVEVKASPITGEKSLHAKTAFEQGDIISPFDSEDTFLSPNYLTIQSDESNHIMLMPEFLRFINHSCSPNAFFDTTAGVVVCLDRIEAGDEITHFYPSTEWSMAQSFQCWCGKENCLGHIKGSAHISQEVLVNYILADHIKRLISEN